MARLRLPSVRRTPEPAATRSLIARLTGGPILRRAALADLRLYRTIRSTARTPQTVGVVKAFSTTGEHAALWLALGTVGAALDEPRRERWLKGVRAVLIAYVLNVLLKNVVRRRRPSLTDLPALIGTPTSLSFPSAHATSSFAAARAFSGLVPAGPLYAVAGAMALSRVYLGVHYPTDIAVGAALGTAVGSVAR